MPSLTVENYVKAIFALAGNGAENDAPVPTGQIAISLGVSPGSVTGMLKTLSEAGLATYMPYEGVRLTKPGRDLALRVLRRHRLIELFLAQTLKLPWDEVHEEAENMEHTISDRLADRIDAILGRPEVDPHGDPIPSADLTLREIRGTPLNQRTEGESFRVVRVVDQDPAFLRYLTECGLDLGIVGVIGEKRPASGAIVLHISGKSPIALGLDAAGKVLVESATDAHAEKDPGAFTS